MAHKFLRAEVTLTLSDSAQCLEEQGTTSFQGRDPKAWPQSGGDLFQILPVGNISECPSTAPENPVSPQVQVPPPAV